MWQTSLLQRAMLASLRPSRGDSGEALSIAETLCGFGKFGGGLFSGGG